MTITYELDLSRFEAWDGAVNTLDRIRREGKCEELEDFLESEHPDGMTETELNDLLWFNADEVYDWLGMRSEKQINAEIEEAESELEDLQNDLTYELDDDELTTEERADIIDRYQPNIDELKEKIATLQEELDEL